MAFNCSKKDWHLKNGSFRRGAGTPLDACEGREAYDTQGEGEGWEGGGAEEETPKLETSA